MEESLQSNQSLLEENRRLSEELAQCKVCIMQYKLIHNLSLVTRSSILTASLPHQFSSVHLDFDNPGNAASPIDRRFSCRSWVPLVGDGGDIRPFTGSVAVLKLKLKVRVVPRNPPLSGIPPLPYKLCQVCCCCH